MKGVTVFFTTVSIGCRRGLSYEMWKGVKGKKVDHEGNPIGKMARSMYAFDGQEAVGFFFLFGHASYILALVCGVPSPKAV